MNSFGGAAPVWMITPQNLEALAPRSDQTRRDMIALFQTLTEFRLPLFRRELISGSRPQSGADCCRDDPLSAPSPGGSFP